MLRKSLKTFPTLVLNPFCDKLSDRNLNQANRGVNDFWAGSLNEIMLKSKFNFARRVSNMNKGVESESRVE